MSENPYEPTAIPTLACATRPPASVRRWAAVGFFAVALPIASLGVYGLYLDARQTAALPPGVTRCGMDAITAMVMIFPFSPMLGGLGAVVGYFAARVWNGRGRSSP